MKGICINNHDKRISIDLNVPLPYPSNRKQHSPTLDSTSNPLRTVFTRDNAGIYQINIRNRTEHVTHIVCHSQTIQCQFVDQ